MVETSFTETDSQNGFKNFSPLLKRLLEQRGLLEDQEIENFLNPNYEEHLHSPHLLNDIQKAADRIIKAVKDKEKILIYSDYDADGIPGAVILHEFFTAIGYSNFENYIPHRHMEGFGLHLEAVEGFAEKKVNLIITIDCGTADLEQIALARRLGMDVIVTDHHETNGKMSDAFAVVNPKRPDSTYPFPFLCGAAVVFKLIQVLSEEKSFSWQKGKEKWFLDMVGLATLSDMVPLVGENRILSFYGLKVLRKSRRPGLIELFRNLGIDQKYLSEDDVTFMITPRINAASRMDRPEDAFRLLATKDFSEARETVSHLNKINEERKGIVASLVKEAKKRLRENKNQANEKIIVIGNPEWRPSLLGLVANSLVEDFGKPVFLWGRDGENIIKGSCRSDGKMNMIALMEKIKDNFIEFGGHKMAGGFSVSFEKIHTLSLAMQAVCEGVSPDNSLKDLETETEEKLLLGEVSWETFRTIDQLSPFGVGNPKPLFFIENVEIESLREFGKQSKHLEISFIDSNVKATRFFMDKKKSSLNPGDKVNLKAYLEKSSFQRKTQLRLKVKDVSICE